MSSDSMPEFEKGTEIVSFSRLKKSLSSIKEFKEAESEIRDLLWLKNAGLSYEEIKLYQEKEAGLLDKIKVEPNAMEAKLEAVYSKMKKYANDNKSSSDDTSNDASNNNSQDGLYKAYQAPLSFYPEGHPMNRIKELEVDVFGHINTNDIPPISKRRKMLRRFERKKERILAHERLVSIATYGLEIPIPVGHSQRSLSDMDIDLPLENPYKHDFYLDMDRSPKNWYEHASPARNRNDYHPGQRSFNEHPNKWRNVKKHSPRNKPIGPRQQQLYTVKENKIVKVDVNEEVASETPLEDQLLEGTKMSIDNIKKIERFKNYDPGVPSKMLYLKNIALGVTQERISLLFNQFVLANGGPVSVQLMTSGRMRGQAFVEFKGEEICVQALSEANGTILSGQPIIAQFGRTNRQPDIKI